MNRWSKLILVLCLLVWSGLAHAQKVEFPAIGVGPGVILTQNQWDPGYSLDIQCELGEMLDYVFLVPYISFWHAEQVESSAEKSITLNMSHLALGTELIGYINSKPEGIFTGVGLGYHVIFVDQLASQYFNSQPYSTEATEYKISLAALAGYQFKLAAFSCAFKLKYYYIDGGYNTFQTTMIFSFNL